MIKLYSTIFAIFLTLTALQAQITHQVNVVNFDFQPTTLTISQGDEVEWDNTQGFHNIDGTLESFPNNPEGFTSGDVANAPWTYTFTFTEVGTYNYQCIQHAAQMQGTIIVEEGVTGIEDAENEIVNLYPNPTRDVVFIKGAENLEGNVRLAIFDITGKKAFEVTLSGQKKIDLTRLKSGIYIYNLFQDNLLIQTGKIARQ